MSNPLPAIFNMSIAGSAVVGLMILLRPITVKIFYARWQYRIGKMAIAFFLLPVFLLIRKLSLIQPVIEKYPARLPIFHKPLPATGFVGAMDTLTEKHLTAELMQTCLFIWFVGAVVFACWHLYCYCRFTKKLQAGSFPVQENTEVTDLFSSCKAKLGIYGKVKLMLNPDISSPMLVGVFRPVIFLPALNIQETDLKLILTHELMHLKRRDLWVKMLALAAGTLHWFNPLVYLLRKDVNTWSELSCDEAMASGMSLEERKLYGEAILSMLDLHSGIGKTYCSSLCDSRKQIERRLNMLLDVKKIKKHISFFAVISILAIGGIATLLGVLANAYASDLNGEVGEASLKNISFKDVADYLEYDEQSEIYRFEGKWVRLIFDDMLDGRTSSCWIEPGPYDNWGDRSICLKTIRNSKTREIEGLVVMTQQEVDEFFSKY